jgi:hypothetical protein
MRVVLSLLLLSLVSAPTPVNGPTTDPGLCRQYYHGACSEAMGAWLPRMIGFNDPWLDGRAKHVDRRDGFVYEGHRLLAKGLLGFNGPNDGTPFVYGNAGPPKGAAVYDYAHHIAFYGQGCCAWYEVVAAADAPKPPKRVVARDLRGLQTMRGIRLGMSAAAVLRIYGYVTPHQVKGHPGLRLLAYTTWHTAAASEINWTCGQGQNFVFRTGRLVWMQIANAC